MQTRTSPRDRCAYFTLISPTPCLLTLVAYVVIIVANTSCALALSSYHIGNSLTWDSRPDYGTPKLATDAGLSLTTGYHIRCSQSLDYILNHPTETCVTPNAFGNFGAAFADHAWDAVTLQPFSNPADPSTPRMEAAAMKSLIQLARQNPNNLNTTFFLYTGWMTATSAGTDFHSAWHDPTPINPDTDLLRNAASFSWIYEELVNDPELAGVDLKMTPVGDVLAEIDQRMTLGTIPGFIGAEDLYRDDLHMNNLGWFVASNTMLATLFRANPTGVPTNTAFALAPGQTEPIEITPELGSLIQNAVWDVITSHPHTGVLLGDLNTDGFVGIDDLNLVLANWNQNVTPGDPLAGDPSDDGFVGIDDLNTVLSNWNASSLQNAAVPEPGTTWLLTTLLVSSMRRPQIQRHTLPN